MYEVGSVEGSKLRNYIVISPNLILKSIIIGWEGHIARMEEHRSAFKMLKTNPQQTAL